ncbi:MAG TPA: DUF4097 family beta strand repeat-containing protein [Blastocatellia bacterium]|nr:DUF4097 family beta strand repeat-containing protein [Blastocatellia bacterium]
MGQASGILMLLAGCTATIRAQSYLRVTAQEEKSFRVSGVPRVLVSTFDGAVRVESWDRAEVLCQAEKRGRSQGDLDRIEIISSQTGDEIRFEAKLTSRANWNLHARANLTIHVPRESILSARTGDGSIEAHGLSGETSLRTGDGSITASNLSGSVIVRTGDGSVDLSDVRGRLQAQTGDGKMHLRGRFTELDARTGDGSMEVTVEPGSQMNAPWSLKTGDGSIMLALPADFAADLDVHTSDGSISTELPVTFSGKLGNTLRGQLNQGGRLLTVRTGDGSITLRRN